MARTRCHLNNCFYVENHAVSAIGGTHHGYKKMKQMSISASANAAHIHVCDLLQLGLISVIWCKRQQLSTIDDCQGSTLSIQTSELHKSEVEVDPFETNG